MVASRSLDELVISAASHLMGVTATTLREVCIELLHELVGHFDVDLSFLRRNDHDRGDHHPDRRMAAETVCSGARPVGRRLFAGADPTFAATEHLARVMITHPDGADDDYQETVREGRDFPASSPRRRCRC